MKTCGDCGEIKPLDEFASRSAKCKLCHNLYTRKHYLKNKQYYKDKASRNRKKNYELHGLTLEQFGAMLEAQDNKCSICGDLEPAHVDHDHKCCAGSHSCGKCVRGILCPSCNHMLGNARDNIDVLSNAIRYLGLSGGTSTRTTNPG